MESREGGSWFVLVVERADKKNLILDAGELSSIPLSELASITSTMMEEGIKPVAGEFGGWELIELHEGLWPGTVPSSIRALAKYIPLGTVITLDNGCLPSIEWRVGESDVDVIDTYDDFPGSLNGATGG